MELKCLGRVLVISYKAHTTNEDSMCHYVEIY